MLDFIILAILDLWCGIAILFLHYFSFPTKWALYCVGYLWLKSLIWRGSIMNLFDVAIGIYILLMLNDKILIFGNYIHNAFKISCLNLIYPMQQIIC